MIQEIDPKDTGRAKAFALWMQAPNPMVTLIKTLDVTRLVKASKKRKLKFNMLMDYCIGKAASAIPEFCYWCGKDVLGLIRMPFSRHWIMHIEAMRRISGKLNKLNGK